MKTSDLTGKLATAEAAAQTELGVAIMDKKNPHYKSEYLSHKGAVEIILPTYAKHGISITQCFRMSGDMLMLDTRFTEKSGEWRESEYPVCRFPERPQVIAANGTYAKRLSLVAMACLAADADDDGNEANKTTVHAPTVSIFETLLSEMQQQKALEALDSWQSKNIARINKLSDKDKESLRKEYSKCRDALNLDVMELAK